MFLVSESHGLGKNKLGVNDVQYLLKTDFSPQSANFEQDNATCHGQDLEIGLTCMQINMYTQAAHGITSK